MKILYIYDQMPGVYQNYLWQTLEKVKKQLNVKVLSYKFSEKADHVVEYHSFARKKYRLRAKMSLVKYSRLDIKIMNDFDILHLQHSYLFPKILPLLKQETFPKIVITLRGADTYLKPWINKKWSYFYKEYGNKIDAYVVMSAHQKEYLQKWNIAQDRINVIPVSFGSKFKITPKKPNKSKLKIVSVFRLTWEKNIEGNLRVIQQLVKNNIPVEYHIYGDGEEKAKLLYLVDAYNLKPYIMFYGKTENELIRKALRDYDFYLQLSLSESFGLSVVEAQSMGLPAIISNSDGLPETISVNNSGFVFESWKYKKIAEAIVLLWKNEEKYVQFSKCAITHSHIHFSTTEEVLSLNKLYSNLV